MASIKYEAAAITSLLTTELNSLASSARTAVGTEYDNSANLYTFGLFELNVTFGAGPTAGTLVDLYAIPAPDGTNYDDGSSSVAPPANCYIGSFPVRAVTTAQKIPLGLGARGLVTLPPTKFKLIAYNGTNQAFPASGSTVKMIPFRLQTA